MDKHGEIPAVSDQTVSDQAVSDQAVSDQLAAEYLAAAPDAILAVDNEATITFANEQAYNLFGYDETIDQLVGMPIERLVPRHHRSNHGALRDKYLANGKRRSMGDADSRVHGQRSDGELIPVEIALSPLAAAGRRGAIAVIRDQTERVRVQVETDRVQQTLDSIGDAVFFLDPVTLEVAFINHGAKRQTGYDHETLTNSMHFSDLAYQFSAKQLRTFLTPLISQSVPLLTKESILRSRDDTDIPVEILFRYVTGSAGVGEKVMAIVRDLSELDGAEHRTNSTETSFRAAFERAPAAMVVTRESDGVEIIVDANPSFHRLLGLKDVELAGARLSDLQADGPVTNVGTLDAPAIERQYIHADGHPIWTSTQASVIRDQSGNVQKISRIEDITRRVMAERQRDQRQLMLATLSRIRKATLLEEPTDKILRTTAEAVSDLLRGDHTFIAGPAPRTKAVQETGPESLIYRSMCSSQSRDLSGLTVPESPIIKQAIKTGQVVTVDQFTDQGPIEYGPGLCAPIFISSTLEGVIVVVRRPSADSFDPEEVASARALAAEIGLTMDLAKTRAERRHVQRIRDRKRIAREIQIDGFQRVSSARNELRAAITAESPVQSERTRAILDELDAALEIVGSSMAEMDAADATAADTERHDEASNNGIGR